MVQGDGGGTSNSEQPTSKQKLRSPTNIINHVTRDFQRQQVRPRWLISQSNHLIQTARYITRAVLSQGEPRDAAVNFVRIEVYSGIARFLCYSTAFLYRPTSVTVQMLKLHKVR